MGLGIQERWEQLHPLDRTAAPTLRCVLQGCVSALLHEGVRRANTERVWGTKSGFLVLNRSRRRLSGSPGRSPCAVRQPGAVGTLL